MEYIKKLCVIIPYRDRLNHLETLLPELKKCLSGIDHKIVVVEQEEGKIFNRGLIKNIGFAESGDCDYYCFHDVDMIPDEIEHDYSFDTGAIHLAHKVKQFDYKMPYHSYFGGVILVTKEDFSECNGYSNNFIGWGCEDDDLYNRLRYYRVKLKRRECKFYSFDHERDDQNRDLNTVYLRVSARKLLYTKDGLNSMNYKLLSTDNRSVSNVDITWLKVSI